MEITSLLIEPSLDSIEKELQELAAKAPHGNNLPKHKQVFVEKVCALLSDLADLKKEVSFSNQKAGGLVPVSVYGELRRLKRETHFLCRTFLKIKSNEARFEKMVVRRNDVSTVAA